MGQNKVRIWLKSQNNGFFVNDNERICFIYRLQRVKLVVSAVYRRRCVPDLTKKSILYFQFNLHICNVARLK